MRDFSHVAGEYDVISREYKESKLLPFRLDVEQYSTFSLLPDLRGRSVVDLACGEGIYSRKLKAMGAARVLGIDISSEMVALAERAEVSDPLGVEYLESDVASVDTDEEFDVGFCSYLFNYARTRGELRSLIESVARLWTTISCRPRCTKRNSPPPGSQSSTGSCPRCHPRAWQRSNQDSGTPTWSRRPS